MSAAAAASNRFTWVGNRCFPTQGLVAILHMLRKFNSLLWISVDEFLTMLKKWAFPIYWLSPLVFHAPVGIFNTEGRKGSRPSPDDTGNLAHYPERASYGFFFHKRHQDISNSQLGRSKLHHQIWLVEIIQALFTVMGSLLSHLMLHRQHPFDSSTVESTDFAHNSLSGAPSL